MKPVLAVGSLAVAAVMLSACATVTRGTSQKFSIESTPDKADVKLSTGQTCVTPCQLKLKRKDGFTATFSKPGYKAAEAKVESELHGGGAVAGAGNIILGGVIGGIVDGSSGAMKNLTPNPLRVTLVAEESPVVVEAVVAEPAVAAPVETLNPAATTDPAAPSAEANPAATPGPGINE